MSDSCRMIQRANYRRLPTDTCSTQARHKREYFRGLFGQWSKYMIYTVCFLRISCTTKALWIVGTCILGAAAIIWAKCRARSGPCWPVCESDAGCSRRVSSDPDGVVWTTWQAGIQPWINELVAFRVRILAPSEYRYCGRHVYTNKGIGNFNRFYVNVDI